MMNTKILALMLINAIKVKSDNQYRFIEDHAKTTHEKIDVNLHDSYMHRACSDEFDHSIKTPFDLLCSTIYSNNLTYQNPFKTKGPDPSMIDMLIYSPWVAYLQLKLEHLINILITTNHFTSDRSLAVDEGYCLVNLINEVKLCPLWISYINNNTSGSFQITDYKITDHFSITIEGFFVPFKKIHSSNYSIETTRYHVHKNEKTEILLLLESPRILYKGEFYTITGKFINNIVLGHVNIGDLFCDYKQKIAFAYQNETIQTFDLTENLITIKNKKCAKVKKTKEEYVSINYRHQNITQQTLSVFAQNHVSAHIGLWEEYLKPVFNDVSGTFFNGTKSIAHEFALMGFYLLSAVSVVGFCYLIFSSREHQNQTDNRIDQTQSAYSEQVIDLQNQLTKLRT